MAIAIQVDQPDFNNPIRGAQPCGLEINDDEGCFGHRRFSSLLNSSVVIIRLEFIRDTDTLQIPLELPFGRPPCLDSPYQP